jgi:BolA family transcriptional regulator, general stress-responsive regulator
MTDRVAVIELRLRQAFAPENLEVVDESRLHAGHEGAKSGGGHYAVTIVSNRFHGHTPVKRHRLVYEALGDLIKNDIHALRITAMSPEEL